MARIAIGGFLHETNTFAASRADYVAFRTPDAWPGIVRADEILPAVQGLNLPLAGFIAEAKTLGHIVIPTLWASCAPSGKVTADAFEAISDELISRIVEAGPVDAIFLDLHGAMVCEHLDDGEGELLSRLRTRTGTTPILAALDFHANVTHRMTEAADLLIAYRTYPHVDMAATGARVAQSVERVATRRPFKALRQASYLIPLHWQSTLAEPMRGLMALAEECEARPGVVSASIAAGFAMADFAESGPAVIVYTDAQAQADQEADLLLTACQEAEATFSSRLYGPEDAVAEALAASGRIILADTQDNPGAGGTSDTTGLLRELLSQRATSVLLGVICDPDAAAAAHVNGVGATMRLGIGGKAGPLGGPPADATWTVEALGDGAFTGTGPFYFGCRMQLGPMARLSCGGVQIVVSSRRQQAADQEMFRHVGAEPADWRILCLKSSVHFRADFGNLAERILIVAAEGENIADPLRLDYRKLRAGIRIAPMGKAFDVS